MLSKGRLRFGDLLILTKPLGFGLTTTALKRQEADERDVQEAVEWMSRLNRGASELALEFALTAGTDVTGFGLLGHGYEMAKASDVMLQIAFNQVPFLKGARKYAERGDIAGGLIDNRSYFGRDVEFGPAVSEAEQLMLFDPQTSGGLLLGVPRDKLDAFMHRAKDLSRDVWVIGQVKAGKGIRVE
jgi:selenide,water dikinase